MACYAGQILVPAESFGQGIYLYFKKRKEKKPFHAFSWLFKVFIWLVETLVTLEKIMKSKKRKEVVKDKAKKGQSCVYKKMQF